MSDSRVDSLLKLMYGLRERMDQARENFHPALRDVEVLFLSPATWAQMKAFPDPSQLPVPQPVIHGVRVEVIGNFAERVAAARAAARKCPVLFDSGEGLFVRLDFRVSTDNICMFAMTPRVAGSTP